MIFKVRLIIQTPSFWYKSTSLSAALLSPASVLYQAAHRMRQALTRPFKCEKPVLCIGNLVAGGAGKTPVTIAIARYLQAKGHTPHILSRGYGSHTVTPIKVDALRHSYQEVGDEPLLLSQVAPTWVCANRQLSALLAIENGATILLMDDGFQNPTLYKDISLLVVDGQQGFGNGQVIPAGPLRESIASGLTRANGIILVGKDHHQIAKLIEEYNKPLLWAEVRPQMTNPGNVIAFAGLGYPQKFFHTLKQEGYKILEEMIYPDHHPYQEHELDQLLKLENDNKARLITTEKDLLRIPLKYQKSIETLKIEIEILNMDLLDKIWADLR